MKLRHKLILILLMFIIAPLTVLGYYFTNEMYNMVLDHTIKTTRASQQQIRENLRERLLTYIQMSNLIISHQELKMFLGEPPDDWQEQLDGHTKIIANEIGRYSVVNPYLKATVYVENNSLLLDHTHIAYADEAVRSAEWYQEVKRHGKGLVWQGLVDKSKDAAIPITPVFSFARPLLVNNSIVGVLLMEINEKHLYSLISEESHHEKFIFIVNPGGEIISSNRRELLGTPLHQYIDKALLEADESYVQAEFDGRNSLLFVEPIHSTSDLLDWKVYTVIPDSYLLNEAKRKRNWGIAVTMLLLIWSVGAVLLVTWQLTKRIRLLAKKMNAIRHGRFGDVVEIEGKDEIAELGHTFNLMSTRLREFVEEVYESQIKRKDLELKQKQTELKALQSQINPHFLFNTLDSIRTGALRSRDDETVEKIELLAQLFRRTISWQDDFIPVETELGFVRDYIRLQQLRFKEKIRFVLEVDPAAEGLRIPKFIIQPIVENAIIHSIEKSATNCLLHLSVRTDERTLRIAVEDNGAGFAPEKLEEVRQSLQNNGPESGTKSIGLRNVHDRIVSLYGEPFGVELERIAPRGAKVTLLLPLQIRNGGGRADV
jgi:Predicted signal transduction protein with a C-terminal ATPase domain